MAVLGLFSGQPKIARSTPGNTASGNPGSALRLGSKQRNTWHEEPRKTNGFTWHCVNIFIELKAKCNIEGILSGSLCHMAMYFASILAVSAWE